ncbi:hypothetical protein Tco_0951775, partial [Tanacetum coccineum]
MNKKNYSFDLETFRDMLQICPNLPGQKFKDPPFEEDILAFIRELGYPGDIKSLSDVKFDTLYQPWRTFETIINKCLSGKATGLGQLRLSRALIIWGMYNQKKISSHKHEKLFLKYGAILLDTLTNQAMKESDAYKTYHDFATGKVIPKPKYVRRSTSEKTDQSPAVSPGKRLKATTKVTKLGKKKLHAQGLETLSEIALSEAEQMKIITKRSKTQFHSSHASDEQISWMPSDEDDDDEVSLSKDDDDNDDNKDDDGQDDDNEQTKSNNDGDDFVHPKFSTYDEEERQDEEDKEEEGDNVEGEELDEEEPNEEEEVNVLYRDVNVNLEGKDTEMTDALLANVQTTQVIEDTHVIIIAITHEVQQQSSSVSSGFISNMLIPNPYTCIDSILNLNTESTSLVDFPVTTNVEMHPSSVKTLSPPPIPQQQTPVSTATIVPSTSLKKFPTFGSLFKFEDRVKALEDDFSEFKQTNLFAEVVSLIPGIVDTYPANKMNEAVKT